VEASKLSNKIKCLHKHDNMPKCKSQHQTFNTETEKQWTESDGIIPNEEFVAAINFFLHTSSSRPVHDTNAAGQCFPQTQTDECKANPKSSHTQVLSADVSNNDAAAESNHDNFNVLEETMCYRQYQSQFLNQMKCKNIKICRRKLQRTTAHKKWPIAVSPFHHAHHTINLPMDRELEDKQEWEVLQEAEQWCHQR
jgi:hypothetical protein